MTLKDTHNAISLQALEDGQLRLDLQGGQMINLCGLEAHPASHSAAQESRKAKLMNATYGLRFFG